MSQRPMFFLALAVGGGICLQFFLALTLTLSAALFTCLFLAALLLQLLGRNETCLLVFHVLVLLTFLCAGTLWLAWADFPLAHDLQLFADDECEVLLFGEVQEPPRIAHGYCRFTLAAHALVAPDSPWRSVQGSVLVGAQALQDVEIGEQLLLRGRLLLPDAARNPGAFDYRRYLKAKNIYTLFQCTRDSALWRAKVPARISVSGALACSRAWVSQQLSRFAHGQARALLHGLLLGERDEVDSAVLQNFARTGLIHVLSVSGLHVGFIALLLYVFSDLLRVPKRQQSFLVMGGLIFYALLTGVQPPVLRATLMALVLLLGNAAQRDADLYNTLGAAALLILIVRPYQFFQLGFQLSFLAVLGIAYLYRPARLCLSHLIKWRWPPARWAAGLLAVSFAAQLATLPVVVSAYGRLPAAALWGNLIVIPATFLAVALSAIACLAALFSGLVAETYGAVAQVVVTAMLAFTQWLARLPGAYVEGLNAPPLLLVAYVLLLAMLVAWRRRARPALLLALLTVLNIFVWSSAWQSRPNLRFTFFDVDQGDAILLEFPHAQRLLVDAGPARDYTDAGTRVLLPYFAREGIRRLQAVVITHPHADHLGGLPALLTSWLGIDTVYFCGVETNSWLEQRCEHLLDSLHVNHRALRAGEMLGGFAPAQIGVLATGNAALGMIENVNNASAVLKVMWGKTSVLLAGDAEWQSEARLLRHAQVLDCDLLKVGHHGSQTSSTLSFLQAVRPQWAVTSVGRHNKFGHPHPVVMARLAAQGISNVRTDQHGAVIFESDGKTLQRLR